MHPAVFLLAGDQSEDLLGKGDHDTSADRKHAVGALGGIVALERQSHLQDTEAQQNQADGADQGKDKIRKIVDDGQWIPCR